jgi:putative glutamine amidotransferase
VDKPLIGITTTIKTRSDGIDVYAAYVANVSAVERAGGLPVMIPCAIDTNTLREMYERIDGILLPGGGDVDPDAYHAAPHAKTANIDRARDQAEMALARWSAAENRPLFAICRGHQVVNVALGGSLIQDIPSQIDTPITHQSLQSPVQRDALLHPVKIMPGTLLSAIMGKQQEEVNSIHHQAIDRLAPSLVVTASSDDGIIEAAEMPGHQFYLSVQWHPEDLQHMTSMQNLYSAFVTAASQGRSQHRLAG